MTSPGSPRARRILLVLRRAIDQVAAYPKSCAACGAQVWANPIPVAVALVPIVEGVRTGLLVVRRAIRRSASWRWSAASSKTASRGRCVPRASCARRRTWSWSRSASNRCGSRRASRCRIGCCCSAWRRRSTQARCRHSPPTRRPRSAGRSSARRSWRSRCTSKRSAGTFGQRFGGVPARMSRADRGAQGAAVAHGHEGSGRARARGHLSEQHLNSLWVHQR